MRISDWSSDVCSSDLTLVETGGLELHMRSAVARIEAAGAGLAVTLMQPDGTAEVVRVDRIIVATGLRPDLEMLRRSEEHTSELQSLMRISYAVVCLKKKKTKNTKNTHTKKKKNTERDTTQ